ARRTPQHMPIVLSMDRARRVELYGGGGGLPYLGSSTSYNAGDWENTLRAYHDNGTYTSQLGKVAAVAAQGLRRAGKLKNKFHFKAKQFGHSARRAMFAISRHGKHNGKHHGKQAAIVLHVGE